MDPVWSTVVGGVIAAAAGGLVAAVNARWARQQAREQREHDRRERRYEDLKSAYVRFYKVMNELVEQAEHDTFNNRGQVYASDPRNDDPLAALRASQAGRDALDELRLFADDALYQAGQAWLDAYLARFWRIGRSEHSSDTGAARERVVVEGKRALRVTTPAGG